MQDVAIFWDYENCPAPSTASGCVVANNIRTMAHPYGRIKSFKAYLAITDQYTVARAVTLRSEFQASGVSLIDCPHNGRKEVADKMIIVDMLTYAIDNPAPSTIILITGDRDFAYPMSILRLRQYKVVLVTLSNAHFTLTAQASTCVDWFSDVLNSPAQHAGSTGSSAGSFTGGLTSGQVEASPPKRSLSNQSVQTEQEKVTGDHKNQVDLLDYLRAASSTRYRRASISSSNYRSPHPGNPRQDTSPAIEVDLSPDGARCTDQIPVSTTKNMNSKEGELESSSRDFSEELSSASTETDKPSGLGDHGDSFVGTNTKAVLSFTTFPPKINEPSPCTPTVASVLQPGRSPVISENGEGDIHRDDSDDESSFIYPVRPASAPDTLPSPNPPVIRMPDPQPILSELPSTIIDYPKEKKEEMVRGTQGNQPTPLQPARLKEESDEDNSSPPATEPSTSLSTALSNTHFADSFSVDDVAPPVVNHPVSISTVASFKSPVSTYLRSPPASVNSSLVPVFHISNGPLQTYPDVNAGSLYYQNVGFGSSKPQYLKNAPPADAHTATAGVTIPVIAYSARTAAPPQKFGFFPPPIGTAAPPTPPSSKTNDVPPVVPPIFKVLVQVLQAYRAKGQTQPIRSKISVEIYKNGTTYKSAGVQKFGQYAALAEQEEIIELGGREGGAWIALKPAWWNADAN